GWDKGDVHKNEDYQKRTNAIAWVGNEKSAHHRGNCAARTQVWNRGMGTGHNLGEHGDQAADKVEHRVAQRTHGIFDLWAESPEEDHVAKDVRPTAMQEHRRENRNPMMAGHDVSGNSRPPEDKGLATH